MEAKIKLDWDDDLLEYCGVAYSGVGGTFKRETSDGTFRFIGTFDEARMLADGYGLLDTGMYIGTSSNQWVAGQKHGSEVIRTPDGTVSYLQYDRGKPVIGIATERNDGTFDLNGSKCEASDAKFRKLKEAALAVEVRPRPAPCPK
jgi:hypothetical protein